MGRRGPAPTPTAILEARGSWRAKNRKQEPTGYPPLGAPPPHLQGVALEHWHTIAAELPEVLREPDQAALTAYCELWSEHLRLVAAVRKEGATIEHPSRGRIKNPNFSALTDIRAAMLQWSRELGLTPASRTRVI